MQAGDIGPVLELEADSLLAWNRQQLEDELRQPQGFQLVARDDVSGKIMGVLCGRITVDEAEILKLSVALEVRRRGIGLQLLDAALDYCRTRGAKNCFLELRASNTAAAKLYAGRGFFEVGRRKGYYRAPVEDAVLLQLAL